VYWVCHSWVFLLSFFDLCMYSVAGATHFPALYIRLSGPPDMAGAGKRFTTKTHCAKFVEDDSTFDAAGKGDL
jgi:hypothetical protein